MDKFFDYRFDKAGFEDSESLEVETGALDVQRVLFDYHEGLESPVQEPRVIVHPLQSIRNIVPRRQVLAHYYIQQSGTFDELPGPLAETFEICPVLVQVGLVVGLVLVAFVYFLLQVVHQKINFSRFKINFTSMLQGPPCC